MKKYLFLICFFLFLSILPGCGKENKPQNTIEEETDSKEKDKPETTTSSSSTEETWATAKDYKATLITTTPIRFLSVTVGSTAEEVNLTWFSPSKESGQVYWTTADDTEFENAYVYSTSVTPSESTSGYYINRVTICGLLPETQYLYQVGNEDALSPSYIYTSPAFSDTFRFTAVGDAQLGKPIEELEKQKSNWHKLLNKVNYHFPDSSFLVSLGDQVNNYNDAEEYNAFLNQGVLYNLALAPVKGNHDMGGPQFSEHFTMPNQSSLGTCDDNGDGDYWFTRGNALFLVLNVMDRSKMEEHSDFIASAIESNPNTKWRILFSHYSPYNGYESYLENAQYIRPYYLDFASKYQIDLIMCGHDHAYMRTYFIQEDGSYQEYESPAVNPKGTMYLTLSSSSGSLYRRPTDQNEAAVSKKRHSPEVTDVQITPESLKVSTYNAETWELTDEFEIQKK